jgi:hypothetical protein
LYVYVYPCIFSSFQTNERLLYVRV